MFHFWKQSLIFDYFMFALMLLQTSTSVESQDLLSWLLNLPNLDNLPSTLVPGSNFRPMFPGPPLNSFLPPRLPLPPPLPSRSSFQSFFGDNFRQPQEIHLPMSRPFRVIRPPPQLSPPIFHATTNEADLQRQRQKQRELSIFPNSDALHNFLNVQRLAAVAATAAPTQPSPISTTTKSLLVDNTSQFQPLTNSLLNEIKMSQFITSTPDPLVDQHLKVFETVKPEILENTIFRSDKLKLKLKPPKN